MNQTFFNEIRSSGLYEVIPDVWLSFACSKNVIRVWFIIPLILSLLVSHTKKYALDLPSDGKGDLGQIVTFFGAGTAKVELQFEFENQNPKCVKIWSLANIYFFELDRYTLHESFEKTTQFKKRKLRPNLHRTKRQLS